MFSDILKTENLTNRRNPASVEEAQTKNSNFELGSVTAVHVHTFQPNHTTALLLLQENAIGQKKESENFNFTCLDV